GNQILARPPLVYLYNIALSDQNYGYGSAGAIILTDIIVIFTLIQGRFLGFGRSELSEVIVPIISFRCTQTYNHREKGRMLWQQLSLGQRSQVAPEVHLHGPLFAWSYAMFCWSFWRFSSCYRSTSS